MRINVKGYGYYVEVAPGDTIWTLKMKIPSESSGILPPSLDDQRLVLLPSGTELSDSGKTIEFYNIHEGSEVKCEKKRNRGEENFRNLLDVCRKKERSSLKLGNVTQRMSVGIKHVFYHAPEVGVLSLSSECMFIIHHSHYICHD
jgi:hypothetical protein